MSRDSTPRLHPAQVCFVVDDVDAGVEECVERFGWGPFHRFSAPVAEARYHDWMGAKHTEVALGMAGEVQVELIHVSEGRDTVGAYQERYGRGFQHLGIHCRSRDDAIDALDALGGKLDDRGEYPGIRFAFVDTPTGPGMFELLEASRSEAPPGSDAGAAKVNEPDVALDRATIATPTLDRALDFYTRAFGWSEVSAEARTLRVGGSEVKTRRARGRAGRLELELIEPAPGADDPYSRHLARGDHGLVHAGGVARSALPASGAAIEGAWLEDGEPFTLHDWAGGRAALQIREVPA